MKYIATFYAHIGAIRFKKECDSRKIEARLMPVPRDLSSSCGTCVSFIGPYWLPQGKEADEIEQIVEIKDEGFLLLYKAENS